MTSETFNQESRQRFLDLTRGFHVGMLATRTEDGPLHVRPMALTRVDDQCNLYLLTGIPSAKVDEIYRSPACTMTFQRDPSVYLVVSGTAELLRNESAVRDNWSEAYAPWFPGGPDDHSLVVIKLNAEIGEYWDSAGPDRAGDAYEFANRFSAAQRWVFSEDGNLPVN